MAQYVATTFDAEFVKARVADRILEGTIGVPDEVDVYTFEGAKDAVVRISMTAGGLDSGLVLVAPSGSGFSDDGGGAGNGGAGPVAPRDGHVLGAGVVDREFDRGVPARPRVPRG